MNSALLEPATDVRYSIGTWVGLPITILVALILLAIFALGFTIRRSEARQNADKKDYVTDIQVTAFWTAVVSGMALLITAVIFTFAWWPFHWEYHQWRPVRGEVSQIDARLLGSSGAGMSQMFVVKYKDSPAEYRCDDSRCASVKVGDVLELTCKRAWQFSGTHGRACNFVASEAKR